MARSERICVRSTVPVTAPHRAEEPRRVDAARERRERSGSTRLAASRAAAQTGKPTSMQNRAIDSITSARAAESSGRDERSP